MKDVGIILRENSRVHFHSAFFFLHSFNIHRKLKQGIFWSVGNLFLCEHKERTARKNTVEKDKDNTEILAGVECSRENSLPARDKKTSEAEYANEACYYINQSSPCGSPQ